MTAMTRWIAVMLVAIGFAAASPGVRAGRATGTGCRTSSQSFRAARRSSPRARKTETASFNNYGLGGSVDVNFNRYVGVEGEVTGGLGITQDLQFTGATSNTKTPNLLNFSGNVVVSAANHSSIVPYVTGGVGGLTLFEKPASASTTPTPS